MFGTKGYESARVLPPPLLQAAIEIEQQRENDQRLKFVTDVSIAAALDLGKRYVDPKAKERKAGEPYYDFSPFIEHEQRLIERAYPWTIKHETPEERDARLDREQDEAFRRAFGGMQA